MWFAAQLGACIRTTTTRTPGAACSSSAVRAFSVSACASAKPRKQRNAADPMALRKMEKFNYDDVPTLGHAILQRKREMLQLLRTVEFEIPKLSAFRQDYTPRKDKQYLRFRFQHYQGEAHPASRKVVLSVNVDELLKAGAVKDEKSKHKLVLLAGSRFHANGREPSGDKGEIKMSCELFPNERQNMKWCSDTLDALVKEANTRTKEIDELRLDPRSWLIRQDKKRHYLRADRPTLKHFPKQWL